MSITEIRNKVNELCSSWEEFKSINSKAKIELEKKQFSDPLTINQLSRINENLDLQQDHIARLEAALKRPGGEFKEYNSSDHEHKIAFNHYLSNGSEHNLRSLEKRSLSTITDTDGGFFISRNGADIITNGIIQYSPMRNICSVTKISGDALELIEDFDNAYAGWTLENESRIDTKTPSISKKIITVHEMYAQPKATQKLIDDASIDAEEWLSKKLSDAFLRIENASFIHGDGNGKPKGLLSYPNGMSMNEVEQIKSGKKAEITTQSLFNLYYSLKENFAIKGKFLMSRAALQACRLLIDPITMKHLWNPSIESNNSSTLLGCEIIQSADMPNIGDGSLAIAFGDFQSAYQIVDRQGISILRDPFTDKPFVKFYATKRVGGGIINGQVVKLLKLSA